MNENNNRYQIENDLIDKSTQLLSKLDPDNYEWILSNEVTILIDAWKELADFFRWNNSHKDIQINVLTIREYIHWMRVLGDITSDELDPSSTVSIASDAKSRAKEFMLFLERYMDEIIKEAERIENNK